MATILTKGWDLITAISQQNLNLLISGAFAKGEIPSTFTKKDKEISATINISAPTVDLNPVQPAGQLRYVGITFPMVGGSVTVGNITMSISQGTLGVITSLCYVHGEATNNGHTDKLSLDFTDPAAIYKVTVSEPTWPSELVTALELGLKAYLQILTPGSISLGEVTFPVEASALVPVGEADFAIQLATDPNQNTLMLLMVTASGSTPTGPDATDFSKSPAIIPSGQQSAFYVSNRLLIQGIIVPQIASSLSVPVTSFSLQGNITTPYTATFNGSKDMGGQYSPELVGLSINVNNNQQVQSAYTIYAHPLFNAGRTYYVEVVGNIFVSISLNNQVITFNTTADKGSGSIKASVLGWLIVVAAIIATFGTLGAFLGAVLAIVVPILITQLKFPITLPPSLLNQINEALHSVTWFEQKSFPLDSIQLPGDLIIFGKPTA